MKIKLTKLEESKNPLYPNNIEVGFEKIIDLGEFKCFPEVGDRFPPISWWSTSPVQRIIDDNTFETYNSIYKWEEVKD
jgi:hypothetical protein